MKFGVIVFPGSNCDHDAFNSVQLIKGNSAEYIWHKDSSLPNDIDAIVIPGGFSYGDYLRCGSIARFSNVMNEVINFANAGKPVIGICNGFQILTESGLLPGVLLRNKNLKFICDDVYLKTASNITPFTKDIKKDSVLRIPIAHGDGNYFADDDTIKSLEDNEQIIFQYSDKDGNITDDVNPNGSINNIAGISNKAGNVLGMMPHPERYSDMSLGCDDGIQLFESVTKILN